MIYFAQPVEGGPIKIGHSSNVESRIVALQSTYRCKLKVLATMEGDFATEQELHKRFKGLRLAGTEQFRPGDELMDFIGQPRHSNPDSVAILETYGTPSSFRLSAGCNAALEEIARTQGITKTMAAEAGVRLLRDTLTKSTYKDAMDAVESVKNRKITP